MTAKPVQILDAVVTIAVLVPVAYVVSIAILVWQSLPPVKRRAARAAVREAITRAAEAEMTRLADGVDAAWKDVDALLNPSRHIPAQPTRSTR